MKKNFYLLTFLVFFLFTTSETKAQLPVGSTAPDITLVDINNVTHNLYTYLDSGYAVLIDNSTTWCSPCWDFHQTHVLDSLNDFYGPNGTISPGKIKVLFIESDVNTGSNELYGISGNTLGDWVTGHNYPIIDVTNGAALGAYYVSSWPNLMLICPDRKVVVEDSYIPSSSSGSGNGNVAYWINEANGCSVQSNGLNAKLLHARTTKNACPGDNVQLKAVIQNMGNVPLTNAVVDARIGSTVIASTNWNGSLNSYDTALVNIGTHTAGGTGSNIEYVVTTNGDVNNMDNAVSSTLNAYTLNADSATLQIKLNFAYDIRWKFINVSQNNTVIQQGVENPSSPGPGPITGPNGTVDYHFALTRGDCYAVEIIDGFPTTLQVTGKDTGHIRLYAGTDTIPSNLLIHHTTNDDITYDFAANIQSVYPAGIKNVGSNLKELKVYPNPTSNILNVKFDLDQRDDITLQLTDIYGKILTRSSISNKSSVYQQFDLAQLSRGIYTLSIMTSSETRMVKVIVGN